MDPLPTKHDNTDLFTAMIAGGAAGVVQTVLTYPLEYFKTIAQIENKTIQTKPAILPQNTMKPLFTGCSPLAVGMALKCSSRMFIFNQFSKFMTEDNSKTSAPQVVVAGLMTGLLETFWVIPFENIKTRMIENSMILQGMRTKFDEEVSSKSFNKNSKNSGTKLTKRPVFDIENNPRINALKYYHNHPSITFSKIVQEIYQTQGICGFKQGSLITILRQCLNSVVWYSTYSSFQQLLDPSRDSITELELIGMGFASSMAVVGITQPIDVLKTRMQTKDYRLVYKDFMTCAALIFFKEGFGKFWSGSVPRLIKVSCSSTVSLMTYEFVTNSINRLSDIKPFVA